ncbi:MAG TPA: hypothetical protein VL096_20780 [Pirellulaceae bacterium]|nr:hypothetical protein [Pirellulaceae bacterium]
MLDVRLIALSPESHEAFSRLRVASWREVAERIIAAIDSNYATMSTQAGIAFALDMARVADGWKNDGSWFDSMARGGLNRAQLFERLRLTAQAADTVLAMLAMGMVPAWN